MMPGGVRSVPGRIPSLRLDLVPSTLELLEAELASNSDLGRLLGAHVPQGWPPGEYDRPAIEYFRDRLREDPEAAGWYGWYAVLRSTGGGPGTLVGAGGFFGPPSPVGVVEIGYSVVPAFERRGYASEMVIALTAHAASDARVTRIVAHTSRENVGSVRVLEKAGFAEAGPGREPGTVQYARGLRER
jgi:[ribosomal protein S5]-alanine N-acetyltransferase